MYLMSIYFRESVLGRSTVCNEKAAVLGLVSSKLFCWIAKHMGSVLTVSIAICTGNTQHEEAELDTVFFMLKMSGRGGVYS